MHYLSRDWVCYQDWVSFDALSGILLRWVVGIFRTDLAGTNKAFHVRTATGVSANFLRGWCHANLPTSTPSSPPRPRKARCRATTGPSNGNQKQNAGRCSTRRKCTEDDESVVEGWWRPKTEDRRLNGCRCVGELRADGGTIPRSRTNQAPWPVTRCSGPSDFEQSHGTRRHETDKSMPVTDGCIDAS